jgi:hypothetical protein
MRAFLPCVVRRGLLTVVVAIATILAVHHPLAAQTDVIRGRVTGVDGQPLLGVRVTATSIPGNVTREAHTNSQGNFQIAFPGGTGDYIMGFNLFGFAYRQVQVKRLADEAVLVANARMQPMQLDSLAVVADQQQRVGRNAGIPDVGGTEEVINAADLPPDLMGDIAAMAASLPGVLLVPGLDGGPDGFSVLGLDADQNSVTLNGMEFGANGLPRDAAVSSSLTTSPFDVSRGGFSGGNFNISSRAGSNWRSRGMSLVLTTPQMQWADRAAQALGNDYTNISLGGTASGPIALNKTFYNLSFQLGRQSRDYQTLLRTNPLGLQTAGVAMDSVSRFLGLLSDYSIPTVAGPARSSRVNDSGQVFGSVDFSPPTSSSGQSVGITFNGNWSRNVPVSNGSLPQLALDASGGEQTRWSGGVQVRHSGYFGLVLTETSAGINLSRDHGDAFLDLPGGRVRVNSVFDDGANSVQNLVFGGNQGLARTARSTNATFQNSLSWFDNANKHRIKLSSEVRYSANTQDLGSNLLGTFSFNSLEDLEAGLPASFSRTLTALERRTGNLSGSLSLGDSYRHSQDLQFQLGVRLDAGRPTRSPAYNPLVESTFGRRNDEVPSPLVLSPRIGFSWTLGQAPEIAGFVGAVRGPRAVIRGGIGLFSNGAGGSQIGSALSNTGLPSGIQQIACVGPAVPIPEWDAYADDPTAIPDHCADGTSGTVFSNAAPNVTLFARDFMPQRTVRSNLSWSGRVLDGRFNLNVAGTYSVNLNQQRSVDLNFDATSRFSLDDGRPVYVEPTSIVPATGAIASRDARVSGDFSRVTEMRSDLASRTAQLSVRVSPVPRGPTNFGWNFAYTYSNIRQQVSGFSSTAGNPLDVEWARSSQGPHQISYNLRYRLFNAIQIGWNGSFRSGAAFTPVVAGDVNGDGYSNDRASIHSPSDPSDPALAAAMQQLLDNASGATRKCLEKQFGSIASRNSCRGPWTAGASSITMTLDRAKFRMPQRGEVMLSLSNPLGAADMLFNGSGDLKGWGQTSSPDAQLLYVRGFDPQTLRYRYEVNQRFGATRPRFQTNQRPVVLTVQVKLDLGPTRERQNLSQQLSRGRTQPGSRYPESLFRSAGTNGVLNPMATILRQQDTLQLSAVQADSIAAMNRRYMYRADSLWVPVARHLATLPDQFEEGAAYHLYLQARRAQIDMLMPIAKAVRELLAPEQRRKLPASVVNMLDHRYLALIRNGTGMYVGAAGSSSLAGTALATGFVSGATVIIR